MNTPHARPRRSRGQIMILFGLLLPILVLFVSLGTDTGAAYNTKAKLSRAVDATALRMANKYNADAARRREIALRLMQSNFRNFLKNATTSSGWSVSGSIDSLAGENQTISDATHSLRINTRADTLTGAITVKVDASTYHSTYFMRILGTPFEKIKFTETATATRFPAVNILVLDLSGSMLTNGGAEGLIDGVSTFVNSFDDSRDYMLVVGYNAVAHVMWPNVASNYGDSHTQTIGNKTVGIGTGLDTQVGPITGLNFYKPSKNFLTGITGNTTSIPWVMANRAGFESYTNGQEGLRLGCEFLYKWLKNDVSPSVWKDLSINIIFFTDGEFNTIRSYIRGPGFGLNKNNQGELATPSRLSIHNTFHNYHPVITNGSISYGGRTLNNLMPGGAHPNTIPAINACFNTDDVTANSSNRNKWVFRDDYLPVTTAWENQFVQPFRSHANRTSSINDIPTIHRMGATISNQWAGAGFLMGNATNANYINFMRLHNGTFTYNGTTGRTPHRGHTSSSYSIGSGSFPLNSTISYYEKERLRYRDYIYVPVAVTNKYFNTTNGVDWTANNATASTTFDGQTHYTLPKHVYDYWNNNATRMSDDMFSYNPCGRFWANHYGSYYRWANNPSNVLTPRKSKFPWIFENSTVTSNTGFVVGTSRLCDYYLDYTMGGQPLFAGTANQTQMNAIGEPDSSQPTGNGNTLVNSSSPDERYFVSNDNDHKATFYKWWSFKDQSWKTTSTGVTTEAYWLSKAQAKAMRSQLKATVYCVIYGDQGDDAEMKNIANDPSAGEYDSNQPEGVFYKTGESTTELRQVFLDIANRIQVKLID